MSLTDQLQEFRAAPSAAGAVALQRAIAALPSFIPDTPWLPQAARLASQERYDEVIRLVESFLPGATLSPDAHRALAMAHAGLGDQRASAAQDDLAELALTAIDVSGDGSAEHPWLTLRVADQYAYLASRGLESVGQSAHREQSGNWLDIHELGDGSRRCFRTRGDGQWTQ